VASVHIRRMATAGWRRCGGEAADAGRRRGSEDEGRRPRGASRVATAGSHPLGEAAALPSAAPRADEPLDSPWEDPPLALCCATAVQTARRWPHLPREATT
jgi:hypothetical protein